VIQRLFLLRLRWDNLTTAVRPGGLRRLSPTNIRVSSGNLQRSVQSKIS
jgi:hypothetical protein